MDDLTPDSGAVNAPPPTKATSSQPQEQLPTDRIAFERQLKLLQAYSHASDGGKTPVNNEDVARVVEMNASTVSLANAFFVKLGFLTRSGREYLPSAAVISYANAHQWSQENSEHEFRPVVEQSWFWQAVRPKLLMRSVTIREMLTDLAQKAMVGPEYRPQLRMLVKYIVASGLVHQDGDSVTIVRNQEENNDAPGAGDAPQQQAVQESLPERQNLGTRQIGDHHPFIEGLLATLPAEGEKWPMAERKKWLGAAEHIFNLIYKEDE